MKRVGDRRLQRLHGRSAAGLLGVMLAAATCADTAASQPASKEDRVFTVGNYPVEAREADAVAAKERAIADGQQAAFRSLLRRIVPVNAYHRLAPLKSVKASEMISAFAVRSERNSSTEYIAAYDFVFQAEAVRRVLDREGVPFLDRQAPKISLLPIYRAPAGPGVPEVFSDARGSDAWLYAWRGLDLANSLTPVNLVSSKREVHPDSIKALTDGDLAAARTIGLEYQTETLVLAYLEPDLGQKKVRVVLAGRDAVAPFILKRTYRLDGPDLAYTAELAAVLALAVLEGRWKAINVRGPAIAARNGGEGWSKAAPAPAAANADGNGTITAVPAAADGTLKIAVEFRSMGEWQLISRELSKTPDITDLDVEGLSSRGARISLRYPGDSASLAVVLAQHGLILRNAGGGLLLSQRAQP